MNTQHASKKRKGESTPYEPPSVHALTAAFDNLFKRVTGADETSDLQSKMPFDKRLVLLTKRIGGLMMQSEIVKTVLREHGHIAATAGQEVSLQEISSGMDALVNERQHWRRKFDTLSSLLVTQGFDPEGASIASITEVKTRTILASNLKIAQLQEDIERLSGINKRLEERIEAHEVNATTSVRTMVKELAADDDRRRSHLEHLCSNSLSDLCTDIAMEVRAGADTSRTSLGARMREYVGSCTSAYNLGVALCETFTKPLAQIQDIRQRWKAETSTNVSSAELEGILAFTALCITHPLQYSGMLLRPKLCSMAPLFYQEQTTSVLSKILSQTPRNNTQASH